MYANLYNFGIKADKGNHFSYPCYMVWHSSLKEYLFIGLGDKSCAWHGWLQEEGEKTFIIVDIYK